MYSNSEKKPDIFAKQYFERINTPIITTGNELEKEQIAEFSSKVDLEELYHYILEVNEATTDLLKKLSYSELNSKFTDNDKQQLRSLQVVSEDENACWLIDYWCSKNIQGLIQMPFSRHWIMHIEACGRIKNKIYKRIYQ